MMELKEYRHIYFLGIGIGAHGIGHFCFERKPPAFFSKPIALLEGPAWLFSIWSGLYK